jgi:hypothetical protein
VKTFSRHRASDALLVELLERLRTPRGLRTIWRAQRLLLCWWRSRPIVCSTCWDGRGDRAPRGLCLGCGRIYFVREAPDEIDASPLSRKRFQ